MSEWILPVENDQTCSPEARRILLGLIAALLEGHQAVESLNRCVNDAFAFWHTSNILSQKLHHEDKSQVKKCRAYTYSGWIRHSETLISSSPLFILRSLRQYHRGVSSLMWETRRNVAIPLAKRELHHYEKRAPITHDEDTATKRLPPWLADSHVEPARTPWTHYKDSNCTSLRGKSEHCPHRNTSKGETCGSIFSLIQAGAAFSFRWRTIKVRSLVISCPAIAQRWTM